MVLFNRIKEIYLKNYTDTLALHHHRAWAAKTDDQLLKNSWTSLDTKLRAKQLDFGCWNVVCSSFQTQILPRISQLKISITGAWEANQFDWVTFEEFKCPIDPVLWTRNFTIWQLALSSENKYLDKIVVLGSILSSMNNV